jgi:hypothetical protein
MRVQYENNIATLVHAKILAFVFSFLPQRLSAFGTVNHANPREKNSRKRLRALFQNWKYVTNEYQEEKNGARVLA